MMQLLPTGNIEGTLQSKTTYYSMALGSSYIPTAMQRETLNKLHEGYLGIGRCTHLWLVAWCFERDRKNGQRMYTLCR